jgi:hypothetical protein
MSCDRIEVRNGNLYLKEYTGDRGWYVTGNKLDTQQAAKNVLQLPELANGRYRCKFTTAQAKDNIKIPKGNINNDEHFEPLARDFPENGEGSGSQLLLESKEVLVEEIYDTVEQRILTITEIQNLLNQ